MDYLRSICSYNLLLLLALATDCCIVGNLSMCHIDKFVEELVGTVQISVKSVFCKVLNDSTIANDSLSCEEVYEHIATSVEVSATPSGFMQLQEAISEVRLDACSTPDKFKITADCIYYVLLC